MCQVAVEALNNVFIRFQSAPPFYFFMTFVRFCLALRCEACLSSVRDLDVSIIHVPDEAT